MYEIEAFKLWRKGKYTTFDGFITDKLSLARETAERLFQDLGVVVAITKASPWVVYADQPDNRIIGVFGTKAEAKKVADRHNRTRASNSLDWFVRKDRS